mmetsp:Transcript_723/g.1046  ORF Transcript_723/g.1046 Transcript_723/m.1046 type:complete len:181 (+) Transcript_723:28-570(+)
MKALSLSLIALTSTNEYTTSFSPSKIKMGDTIDRTAFVKKSSIFLASALTLSKPTISPSNAVKYENEYLKEPTQEFLQLQQNQEIFSKKMRAYKAEWNSVEARLVEAATDAEVIASILSLQALLDENRNLPEGKSSFDLFKLLRRKRKDFKLKGSWGTEVDIPYEDFIRAVNRSKKPDNS